MLDIFNEDPFTVHNLTEAVNILPYVPSRIGAMGLFKTYNPTTNTVFMERRGEVISLLQTKVRGSGDTQKKPRGRSDMIPFMIPHIPYTDDLWASDLSGLREFDTETQVKTASSLLNEKLEGMRQDHEVTHEHLRLGALKGIVMDGDGTTELLDLFTAFNVSQEGFYFNLSGSGENIKATCIAIIRFIESILGGAPYDHIHCMCGDNFFDSLSTNEEVKKQYAPWVQAMWAIKTQGQGTAGRGTSTIEFGDITFENYRGKVGDVSFVDTNQAHFFPVGVPGLFRQYFGPANTMDAVNTPGRELYAMQKPKEWNEGIDIRTESNPLMICVRPRLLVLGYAGEEPQS